jgi:DNA-binding beta-propeller fold protein YncE
MTASPAVPEVQPSPEGGAVPPEVATEEPPRRRKLLLLLLLLLAFAILLGLASWYLLFRQPISVPTIPGEAIMPGYVTTIYGAQRPMDVAVTADGDRVYIGETAGDNTARVFDAQGKELAQMLPPVSTGANHVPIYLAVNPVTAEVYVSDRPTSAIYIYDAAGTYQRAFTPPAEAKGWQPLGMTFDADGTLYVTDVGSAPNRVWVIDPTGKVVRTIGENDGLAFPNDVAVDAGGYAYVTDSSNGRLMVYGTDGALVAKVGRGTGAGNLGLPRGVAVDQAGRVYVVDTSGQAVFVYGQFKEGASRLEYLGSFGTPGVANGTFAYPNGIAVDGRGRLYVADSANDRVQLWSY